MFSRRHRARLALGTALLSSTMVLVVACGLSVTGSESSPSTPPPNPEASLPGRGDANFDAPPDPGDAGDADAPASGRCASERGPSMVPVGEPDGGFCIDSTEVTLAQYKAFVDAFKSGLFTGDAGCAVGEVTPQAGMGNGPANFPVTAITWCAARSYCIWAGKHLCSGAPGGEWARACTAEGTRSFPYGGDAAVSERCNAPGGDLESIPTRDAGCAGNDGLFDMVGNAAEWTDSCSGPDCEARGGSYMDNPSSCSVARSYTSASFGVFVGFRCCR